MRDQDWDIKERAAACTRCESAFADRQAICSKLTFGEEGYARWDMCEPCWQKEQKADALSVWRGVYRAPPPPAEEPLKKDTAESLLRQLIEKEDPAHANTIYILAVMLERRRILAEKDVQVREDGAKIRLYEHKKTGEAFLIPDPELKLAELEQVQEEVVVMLGGKPRAADAGAPGTKTDDQADQSGKKKTVQEDDMQREKSRYEDEEDEDKEKEDEDEEKDEDEDEEKDEDEEDEDEDEEDEDEDEEDEDDD